MLRTFDIPTPGSGSGAPRCCPRAGPPGIGEMTFPRNGGAWPQERSSPLAGTGNNAVPEALTTIACCYASATTPERYIDIACRVRTLRGFSAMIGTTKKAFHDFLLLLHGDPTHAGHEYENIRRKLTSFFRWNHCRDAENLADETIDRVIRRTQELKVSNVHAYINGVARNVFLEARRHNARRATFDDRVESPTWDTPSAEEEERQLEFRVACLKRCLQNLTPLERQLIMDYELPEKGLRRRKELAESLGITLETLRVQVFRARRKLRALVAECLQRQGES